MLDDRPGLSLLLICGSCVAVFAAWAALKRACVDARVGAWLDARAAENRARTLAVTELLRAQVASEDFCAAQHQVAELEVELSAARVRRDELARRLQPAADSHRGAVVVLAPSGRGVIGSGS